MWFWVSLRLYFSSYLNDISWYSRWIPLWIVVPPLLFQKFKFIRSLQEWSDRLVNWLPHITREWSYKMIHWSIGLEWVRLYLGLLIKTGHLHHRIVFSQWGEPAKWGNGLLSIPIKFCSLVDSLFHISDFFFGLNICGAGHLEPILYPRQRGRNSSSYFQSWLLLIVANNVNPHLNVLSKHVIIPSLQPFVTGITFYIAVFSVLCKQTS